jgi:hypothetical protein
LYLLSLCSIWFEIRIRFTFSFSEAATIWLNTFPYEILFSFCSSGFFLLSRISWNPFSTYFMIIVFIDSLFAYSGNTWINIIFELNLWANFTATSECVLASSFKLTGTNIF